MRSDALCLSGMLACPARLALGTPFAPCTFANCIKAIRGSHIMMSKLLGRIDEARETDGSGQISGRGSCRHIAYSMKAISTRGGLTNSCYSSTLTSLSRTELRRMSPTPDYRNRFVHRRTRQSAPPLRLVGFPQWIRYNARQECSELRWVRFVITSAWQSQHRSPRQSPRARSVHIADLRVDAHLNTKRGEVEVRFDLGGVCE